ncbi:MAG: right-handed parallel beta-helix repeat-containing protein [Sphingomonas sp.]|uniref:right-handed parallel beta-helix repeat-containing protein n=1 Tax=Sphingomonas sp. TaxID=28214 RepID=UPI0025E1887A|nr:right-handed parallel beta-helix repeat-containing protein [Sphingomonas sp.]MBX3565262.1 right-handed parallel beta-helix repeat-containing protein [Sphingomonas sp.]
MADLNDILVEGQPIPVIPLRDWLQERADEIDDNSLAIATGTIAALIDTRVYATQAALFADLVPADGLHALVTEDPDPLKNGLYRKHGATATGNWGTGPLDIFASAAAALVQPLAQSAEDWAAAAAASALAAAASAVEADISASAADGSATAAAASATAAAASETAAEVSAAAADTSAITAADSEAAANIRAVAADASASAAEASETAADASANAAASAAAAVDLALSVLPTAAGAFATLDEAITAAGVGGVLVLQPGVTYTLDHSIRTLEGQQIVGYGATLKRCDQIVTTTTTAIVLGTTNQVTLTDASAFMVGMQVAFAQQGVARSALVFLDTLSDIHTITDKDGDTITLDRAVGCNIDIGGTCFLTFMQLTLSDGASVEGLTFDGNRDNFAFARWEVLGEVASISTGANQSVSACTFLNAPGEGIIAQGNNMSILNNRFDTLGGNGIHLSSVVEAVISGNKATNGNIDIAVGHSDGFISFSNGNSRIVVTGNLADTFIAGVGAINDSDSDVTVTDNDFRNMYCFGIEGGGSAYNLIIARNRIDGVAGDITKRPDAPYYGGIVFIALSAANYSVGGNAVTNVASGQVAFAISMQPGSKNLKVFDNSFGGNAVLSAFYDSEFVRNTVEGKLSVWRSVRTKVNENIIRATAPAFGIDMYGSVNQEDIEIENNKVTGGSYGINFSTDALSYRSISCRGNKLYNQTKRGINFAASAATINGFTIDSNAIIVGPDADTDFLGIVVANNLLSVNRNTISNALAASARVGIYLSGASTPALVAAGNEVRGAWGHTILLTANAGAIGLNNVLQTKDVSVPTGNNFSGTVII